MTILILFGARKNSALLSSDLLFSAFSCSVRKNRKNHYIIQSHHARCYFSVSCYFSGSKSEWGIIIRLLVMSISISRYPVVVSHCMNPSHRQQLYPLCCIWMTIDRNSSHLLDTLSRSWKGQQGKSFQSDLYGNTRSYTHWRWLNDFLLIRVSLPPVAAAVGRQGEVHHLRHHLLAVAAPPVDVSLWGVWFQTFDGWVSFQPMLLVAHHGVKFNRNKNLQK